mmetsp:Transcript_138728/g.386870  ORF Transcript_138728/g.386870 Transcript_138728/m.386870 type:complete len:228 (-) Transcript_138728:1361-2044(-)
MRVLLRSTAAVCHWGGCGRGPRARRGFTFWYRRLRGWRQRPAYEEAHTAAPADGLHLRIGSHLQVGGRNCRCRALPLWDAAAAAVLEVPMASLGSQQYGADCTSNFAFATDLYARSREAHAADQRRSVHACAARPAPPAAQGHCQGAGRRNHAGDYNQDDRGRARWRVGVRGLGVGVALRRLGRRHVDPGKQRDARGSLRRGGGGGGRAAGAGAPQHGRRGCRQAEL